MFPWAPPTSRIGMMGTSYLPFGQGDLLTGWEVAVLWLWYLFVVLYSLIFSAYILFISSLSLFVSTVYPKCCQTNNIQVTGASSVLISHCGWLIFWICYVVILWDSLSLWLDILSCFNIAKICGTWSCLEPTLLLAPKPWVVCLLYRSLLLCSPGLYI